MTSVSRRIRSIGRRHGADFWFIASVGCLFASKPRFFSIFVEKMAIFGEKARPAGSRLTCYDYQTAKQACHVSSDQERARCQQLRSPGTQIAFGPFKDSLIPVWVKCLTRLTGVLTPDDFEAMFGVTPEMAKSAIA